MVFIPLRGYLSFVIFSKFVRAQELILHSVAGLFAALLILGMNISAIVKGAVSSASVGVWATTSLFDLN